MEFSVCYEFAVQRRIPWEDDVEALRKHVTEVRTYLEELDSVEEVRTTSSAANGHLTLEFVIYGANRQTVESAIPDLLGSAIRNAGAYHKGLFRPNEEMRLRPKLNQWSGLRTPTWRVKRTAIVLARSVGATAATA